MSFPENLRPASPLLHQVLKPLVVLLLALSLSSCNAQDNAADSTSQEAMILKSYQVPAENQEEIKNALYQVLGLQRGGEYTQIGRVESTGEGSMLVSAPAQIHAGVAQFLKDFKPGPALGHAPKQIDLWIVTSDGQNQENKGMGEIQPALEAIRLQSEKQISFDLVERLSTNYLGGEHRIRGGSAGLSLEDGGRGSIKMSIGANVPGFNPGMLETEIVPVLGKVIVLGQSGLRSNDGKNRTNIYYIIRVSAAD